MIRDNLYETLRSAVGAVCARHGISAEEIAFELSVPPRPDMGDFSCNAAMIIASRLKAKPRDIAEELVAQIDVAEAGCERVEIAGPGFVNIHLGCRWLQDAVGAILAQGKAYGRCADGSRGRVQLEFISANPVGPMHIGNARGGPYGDVLAAMLEAVGYEVCREYYVNDGPHNTQALKFGGSLQARYRELAGLDFCFPEDGYQGEYVVDMARELLAKDGDRHGAIPQDDEGAYAFFRLVEPGILADARRVCEKFGIMYDNWFHEADLYATGAVEREMERLKQIGSAYEKDGVLWLRTTAHGDDQDRVLVRQDNRPTYIASDAAYALYKYENFDLAIYILGPDHAGYVPRLKAAIEAGGNTLTLLDTLPHSAFSMPSCRPPVRLSKRRGEVVTLEEIVDEVGKDAARFFFLMRSVDSHLDFDLELAKKQSDENPVYYVQYAHARICSIERQGEERGLTLDAHPDLSLLKEADELALMRVLADYPHDLQQAAQARAPHRLTTMARDLAATFHQFYTTCRVLDPENIPMSTARMALVQATQRVLANMLEMMGLETPQRM